MGRSMTVSPTVTLTPPIWAGEFLSPQRLIPAGGKVTVASFLADDAVLVTAGATIAGATTLVVTALPTPGNYVTGVTIIPTGTVLNFGTTKFATVNDASVLPGDTAITVLAVPTAFTGGETATYTNPSRLRSIPSGTVIGRTFTERETNVRFDYAATGDDEVFIIAFDETSVVENDGDVTLVKPGTMIKENFLPGWSGLSAAVKALVRLKYVTQKGIA